MWVRIYKQHTDGDSRCRVEKEGRMKEKVEVYLRQVASVKQANRQVLFGEDVVRALQERTPLCGSDSVFALCHVKEWLEHIVLREL